MLITLLCSGLALAQDAPGVIEASATLAPRSGSRTTGLVHFSQAALPVAPAPAPTGTTIPAPAAPPRLGEPGAGASPNGAEAPASTAEVPPARADADRLPDAEGRAAFAGRTPDGSGGAGGASAQGNPIQVAIRLVNAAPGNHAVFLHEYGDCSAPDASSVGGYYAGLAADAGHAPAYPAGLPGSAGAPLRPEPGAEGTADPGVADADRNAPAGPPPGYLGFVTVGAEGVGEKELTLQGYTLLPGGGSLLDRAVVVYERAPDFLAGEEVGARQACGVIRARTPAPLGTE